MSDEAKKPDPFELIRDMWGRMGLPMQGMVTPTLTLEQLDKRINDLRSVEEWLKVNLNMLQMSIQTLEVQRTTLATMRALKETVTTPEAAASLFANPALWPWNLLKQQQPTPADEGASAARGRDEPPKK